jgi:hypothetical protein
MLTRIAAKNARRHGTKVFYMAHGFHFYDGAPAKNWILYYPIEKFSAHLADTIITITAISWISCILCRSEDIGFSKKRRAENQSSAEQIHRTSGRLVVYKRPLLCVMPKEWPFFVIKSVGLSRIILQGIFWREEGGNMPLKPYDRDAAVRYAHRWAYSRNPAYFDFSELGGDCTNFVSQCIYAGSGVMNFTPTYGWYYINAQNRAPAWTGVQYLHNFLLRSNDSIGPRAVLADLEDMRPGDVIQLSFQGTEYQHTALVVAAFGLKLPNTVLVAAHSMDTDYRPLSTYDYKRLRCLHILGTTIP